MNIEELMNKFQGDLNKKQIPRNGKGAFVPGKPKKKAHQHPIDESGPPIKIKKNTKYKPS